MAAACSGGAVEGAAAIHRRIALAGRSPLVNETHQDLLVGALVGRGAGRVSVSPRQRNSINPKTAPLVKSVPTDWDDERGAVVMAATATSKAPTIEDARRAADAIAEAAGDNLAQVLLYGSVARGEQHEHSDIDLMVVLGDLDYDQRWEVQTKLEAAARSGDGGQVSVHATDVTEWFRRRQVSSSFEANIAKDVICLASAADSGSAKIKMNKEMDLPMSNEEEALSRVESWLLSKIETLQTKASIPYANEKSNELAEIRESSRLTRIRGVCDDASMMVEQALKIVITIQGEAPVTDKELQELEHNVSNIVKRTNPPIRERLEELIKTCPLSAGQISMWRVKGTYDKSFKELSEHADEFVDDYLRIAFSVSSEAVSEVERATGETPETESFWYALEKAEEALRTTNVRAAEPLNGNEPDAAFGISTR